MYNKFVFSDTYIVYRYKYRAPRAGIYYLSFAGLARYPVASSASRFRFGLNLNGVLIGRGQVAARETPTLIN